MNGKEPLVFHDFFEYIGTKSEEKYQISTTDVDSSKGSGNRLTLVEETEVCVVSPDSASQVEESISPAILSGPFSAELQTSEEITSGSINSQCAISVIMYSLILAKRTPKYVHMDNFIYRPIIMEKGEW